jgi:hypothetical protein
MERTRTFALGPTMLAALVITLALPLLALPRVAPPASGPASRGGLAGEAPPGAAGELQLAGALVGRIELTPGRVRLEESNGVLSVRLDGTYPLRLEAIVEEASPPSFHLLDAGLMTVDLLTGHGTATRRFTSLEGSLQHTADEVRIAALLIDSAGERLYLSGRIDRGAAEVGL